MYTDPAHTQGKEFTQGMYIRREILGTILTHSNIENPRDF
jgi:hypothetical protein